MRKILYSLCLVTLLTACNGGTSNSNNGVAPPTITSISTAPYNNDFSQSLFSTYINFDASQTINSWQFGFYVARTFYTYIDPNPFESQNNANTQMTMKVCQVPQGTPCATLEYLKASAVTENDLSAGYTNILAPTTPFPLVAGNSYQVQIVNSNQWSLNNLSSAPQNLFFIVNGEVLNTPTESSIYNLNINESANQQAIASYNQNNWNTNTNLNQESSIIVPSPVSYILGTGNYVISNGITIHNGLSANNVVAEFFKQDLANDLGITANIDNSTTATTGIIIEPIGNQQSLIESNPEGYQIIIDNNSIVIKVLNNSGAFYALQTLRQLWNARRAGIQQSTIIDYPRFAYRGILLDSSRHFFSLNEVESLIDIAATHKLNTLHWHLSDDEGTRIAMQSNNILGSRGYGQSMNGMMLIQSNLDPTNYLNLSYPTVDSLYSGSYTQADIRNIIEYANSRNITIIPEIDSPGHARALIKAFPTEFIDPNDHSQYFTNEGYTDDALPVCTYGTNISVGQKFTQSYNQLYSYLNGLFSGQQPLNNSYLIANEISVGGDEVADQTWYTPQNSSCAQNTEFALLNALEKEHLFFKKFAAQNTNLVISGWQQFIQTNESELGVNIVPANQVGHVWVWNNSTQGQPQAVTLAEAGYPVVLDYSDETYFDLVYTPSIYEPGFYWATSWSNTYSALKSAISVTNTIAAISTQYQSNIKGLEGTLWSENMPSYQHLIYMATPKMAGLAEAAWSPASITNGNNATAQYPNWQSLAHRLGCGNMTQSGNYQGFLAYLSTIYGIHYRGYPNGINLEAPAACAN